MIQKTTFYGRILSRLIFIVVVLFATFSSFQASATHSSGADLQYTWVSGNTFKVTVSFYRDCEGVAAPATITLNAKSTSCSRNQNYTLNLDAGTGQEITFPCRTVITKCTSSGSANAGYQRYVYSNNITLPQQCTDWVMSFFVCCRNCAITTLNNPCSDNMYIEATLNNVVAPRNNSAQFTNIPVALICVNQSFTYNHGVFDPDGDSLVYSFITPKTFNTSTNTVGSVTFNPGFSSTSPLTSSPAVTLDGTNGDITMFPTVNGEIGVCAIMVREYRNGVLIGSAIRDMQFLTRICNPNFLPTSTGINGTGTFEATVCPGSTINFTVSSADPNAADTVVMSWNNSISTATFNTVGAKLPVGTFNWTPTLADARAQPYTFIVIVRDNACPYAGSQTYSFIINVPVITASVSSPTFSGFNVACNGASTGAITATGGGGTTPYTYLWNPSGQTTQTATGLAANTYSVTVSDANGCTKSASTTLTQPPTSVSASISGSTNVTCFGASNGTATATSTGGVSPYTYSWSPSGQTTATASGLGPVNYTVTATDVNGCTSQQSVLISQPTALGAVVSQFDNVTCRNNANGSMTIVPSGGTGPYTHHWSNGDTTAAITNLGPGNYTDTIRDANNCVFLISQTITEPPIVLGIPASSVTTSNVNCFGGADGTASVNPAGGTLPYAITWSNGDTGTVADSLIAGNYQVTIVDGNNCSFDSTITITAPSALSSSFVNYATTPGGTDIACFGQTTGQAKVTVTGGTFPYTYSWSNGATVDSIINVGAGIYNVTVTDDNGCTQIMTDTITEPAVLGNVLNVRHVACKGESSGYIIANVAGGSPAYSYAWTPNISSNDSAYLIPAGFYSLTTTDLNGCTRIDTLTITEPDTLVPLILPSTFIGAVNLRCYGDSSGSATVTVFGGTPPFTYQWSTGATTVGITDLIADKVTVRVEDFNGCSIEKDTTLTQPPPFQHLSDIEDPLCFGDSSGYIKINLSGSTPPYTYAWNTGQTTDSIGGLTSGSFYVIVEDVNNCQDSLNFTMANPDSIIVPAIVSDYQGYNISCNGGTNGSIEVFPFGGDNNFTYTWSSSQTTDSITGLSAGTYDLTILDGRGCRKDTSIVMTEPLPLNLTLLPDTFVGGTNVRCFGYNDGGVHSTVIGGVSPYEYLWSNGDVADSAVGLSTGTYMLTVTDSNGCIIQDSVDIIEPDSIALAAIVPDFNGFNIPCFGDTSACITLNMIGGNSPFTFVWDGVDTLTVPTRCDLGADTLNIMILDGNGCSLDTFFIISGPPPIGFNSVLSGFGSYNIDCFGTNTGSIDVTMTGGVSPYNYLWTTSDTSEDLTSIGAGSYQVNVMDANGCIDSASFTLTEPAELSATVSSTPTTCGLDNGTATAIPTGGVLPYTYAWTGSQTTSTATNLPAQLYFITVTDSLGCIFSDVVSVTASSQAVVSVNSFVNNTCFGTSEGSATATLTGGVAPFSYLWSNGDTTFTTDSLAAGSYTIQVTDSNNCISTGSVTITEPNAFSFTYSVNNAFCNGANNGSVTVAVTGGTGSYQFNWSNGDLGTFADSLPGGYVSVQVTDSVGCTLIDSVNIIQGTSISSTIAASNDVSCFGGNNGSASVNAATGGIGPLTYTWSNGDTGLSTNNLVAGVYTMDIVDSVNCSLTLTITINEPLQLALNLASTNVTCFGDNNGIADAQVAGGTGTYTYAWTPNISTAATLTSLSPGTYSVVITDQNLCTTNSSVTITEPNQIVSDAGQDIGDCEESFILNATLNSPYNGLWSVVTGTANFSDATSPLTTVSGLTLGDNLLLWTVTDGTCFGSDTLLVRRNTDAECELEIPTGVTPNDDGKNDALVIHGIERYPDNILTIYNRWGNLVYQKENYANEWVGQNDSNELLPEGTYFIVLVIKNTTIQMTSYIDLRRQ